MFFMKKIITIVSIGVIANMTYASEYFQSLNKNEVSTEIQNGLLKESKHAINYAIREFINVSWDAHIGILYKRVPGMNLGVISFQVLDNNNSAFLSNSTNEIVIVSNISQKVLKRFPVVFAPRDFVFENGLFYILGERKVVVYDQSGNEVNRFSFPDKYAGTERITRIDNETYLLLPSGNSLKIESNKHLVEYHEQEGWITSNGSFISTAIENNSYSIKLRTSQGKLNQKEFISKKKVAGVFVVGSTDKRIILDVQYFLSENPVSVERYIVSIPFDENAISDILISKKLPDCYYVLSNKEIDIDKNGTVYNMITSPLGIRLFSLLETRNNDTNDYPVFLKEIKYHFNDHLIVVE